MASAKTLSEIYDLAEWWTVDGKVLTESEWALRSALHANHATQAEVQMIAPGSYPRVVAISSVPLRDGPRLDRRLGQRDR